MPEIGEQGQLYRKVFRAILATLAVICVALFIISSDKLILQPWSGTIRQVAMVLLGALLAIVLREIVLGSFYRFSTEEVVTTALRPMLDRVESTLRGEIQKTLPEVKKETVRSIEDIRDNVSKAAEFMITGIGVLSGAKTAGIVNIFPTRYDKVSGQSVIDAMAQDFENEPTLIRLMGISLGDFFLDRGVLHRKFVSLLVQNSSCKVQALLVAPKCEALRERARWEAGPEYHDDPAFWDSTTFIETDGAARIARRLCQQHSPRIEVRLYQQAPTLFLALTTRSAFAEGYNYAARGSNVPIFQIQAGSSLYRCFDSHFERIWNVAETIANYEPLKASATAGRRG